MKKCATCGHEKPETDFNFRYKALGIRHPTCRECHKTYRKNWYEDHKEEHLENVQARKLQARKAARNFVFEYLLTHPCKECGENDPIVLEFHHLAGKDLAISVMVSDGYPIPTIQAEIDKTEVLCANCHRKRTAKERGWFRGTK